MSRLERKGEGLHMSEKKTNAMRILDKSKVAYETLHYTVDEEHLDARTVAETVGREIVFVYKTLVLRGNDRNYYVCVINGADELDLKKTAKAFGIKSIEMIPVKDINKITGYIRGGCSPIGMKKPYPTVFDEKAEELEHIIVSAGQRGMQVEVRTSELVDLVGGRYADVVK